MKTGTDLTKLVPKNDELRGIIEKIAEFLKNFVKLFAQLQEGLAETFSKYVSPYGNTSSDDVEGE